MKVRQFNGHMLRLALASNLAMATALLGVDGYAAGTATANLSVTATIDANCTISTSPVAFGSYDPIVANAAAPLDSTGTVTTACTNGTAATITLGQGSNPVAGSTDAVPLRQMASGANRLPYFLYSDNGRTTIWGNTSGTGMADTGIGADSALTVYGRIPPGQNQPAGNYSDTVVATVTY